jgi:hypothetical protein
MAQRYTPTNLVSKSAEDARVAVGIPTKSIIVSEVMSITRSEVMPIRIGAKRR